MNKQLFLHVGTEKTASTALQKYLSKHRDLLAQNGFLYPASLGEGPHVKLTACCLDFSDKAPILQMLRIADENAHETLKQEVRAKLRQEISQSGAGKVIISDEHINVHLITSNLMARISDILEIPGDHTTSFIYLRRQDRLLEAMMSEAIKVMAFQHYCYSDPIPKIVGRRHRFEYLDIVTNLEKAFLNGKVLVRGYREADEFDAVQDFSECAGINSVLPGNALNRANLSIPARLVQNLVLIGKKTIELNQLPLMAEWRGLVEWLSGKYPGMSFRLKKEDALLFMERFQESNETLIAKYPDIAPTFALEENSFSTGCGESRPEVAEICDVSSEFLSRKAFASMQDVCKSLN